MRFRNTCFSFTWSYIFCIPKRSFGTCCFGAYNSFTAEDQAQLMIPIHDALFLYLITIPQRQNDIIHLESLRLGYSSKFHMVINAVMYMMALYKFLYGIKLFFTHVFIIYVDFIFFALQVTPPSSLTIVIWDRWPQKAIPSRLWRLIHCDSIQAVLRIVLGIYFINNALV